MAGVFGQKYGAFGAPSAFANTNNNSSNNPFGSTSGFGNQRPLFGGNSTGIFGAPSATSAVSTPSFSFGQASGSFGSPSAFGKTNNASNNPFAPNTSSGTAFPSFQNQRPLFSENSTGVFGPLAAPSPTSSSSFMFGQAFKTSVSPSIFGNTTNSSSNSGSSVSPSIFGHMNNSSQNPFTANSVANSTSQASPSTFSSFPSVSSAGNSRPFQMNLKPAQGFTFGVPQAALGQDKGSKITPYKVTTVEKDDFLSISAMPIYVNTSHEELRWVDYEQKLGGQQNSASQFAPQAPAFGPISPSAHKPFSSFPTSFTPTPAWNSVPSSNTTQIFAPRPSPFQPGSFSTPALSGNITPSSTTTPCFGPPSSFQPAFPSPTPSSNLFPSSNTTLAFTTRTSLFPPSSFSSPALSCNSTPSSTTTPGFGPPSSSQPNFYSPAPSSKLTPSSHTKPGFPHSSLFQPSVYTSPALSCNSTPSSTTTPGFGPLSYQPAFYSPAPSSNSIPSNTITPVNTQPVTNSSLPPLFVSTGKAVNCIEAVKDPFGSQTVSSQPSMGHSISSSLIWNGISNMPVRDELATTRSPSLVTLRHVSRRPLTLHVRKYQPKGDEPKVPFFDYNDGRQYTCKQLTPIILRENPRSAFGVTTELSQVNCTKEEASSLIDVFDVPQEDGGDNAKKDQNNNSSTAGSLDNCLVEVNVDTQGDENSINGTCIQLRPSLPKLQRSDYYTQPSIQELASVENYEPGFCSHVKDFVVGRLGYGCVKFDGNTDVRDLDLDALVHFNKREVIVYADENDKPAVGDGLNKPAEVTLLNIKCIDKSGKQYTSGKLVDKFIEKLKKIAEDQGAEFVSYDAVEGTWKFSVKHFSRYGVSDENWPADEYHVFRT